ncbi:MAG TPA: helix-turn-helix transcriptional regulator [Thermoanaerobaculia bacterium]|jgi:transcriptional regulator with XRE-family HTH domain|nr:helix-turn-helix transcriptional regulator [Thermoanaerobaculia bacterium]
MTDSERNAIRRVRVQRRHQQYRVAEAAGISRQELSAYERGRERPSIATLTAVLTALGCSAEEFGRTLDLGDASTEGCHVHRPGHARAGPAVGAGGALAQVPIGRQLA